MLAWRLKAGCLGTNNESEAKMTARPAEYINRGQISMD